MLSPLLLNSDTVTMLAECFAAQAHMALHKSVDLGSLAPVQEWSPVQAKQYTTPARLRFCFFHFGCSHKSQAEGMHDNSLSCTCDSSYPNQCISGCLQVYRLPQ